MDEWGRGRGLSAWGGLMTCFSRWGFSRWGGAFAAVCLVLGAAMVPLADHGVRAQTPGADGAFPPQTVSAAPSLGRGPETTWVWTLQPRFDGRSIVIAATVLTPEGRTYPALRAAPGIGRAALDPGGPVKVLLFSPAGQPLLDVPFPGSGERILSDQTGLYEIGEIAVELQVFGQTQRVSWAVAPGNGWIGDRTASRSGPVARVRSFLGLDGGGDSASGATPQTSTALNATVQNSTPGTADPYRSAQETPTGRTTPVQRRFRSLLGLDRDEPETPSSDDPASGTLAAQGHAQGNADRWSSWTPGDDHPGIGTPGNAPSAPRPPETGRASIPSVSSEGPISIAPGAPPREPIAPSESASVPVEVSPVRPVQPADGGNVPASIAPYALSPGFRPDFGIANAPGTGAPGSAPVKRYDPTPSRPGEPQQGAYPEQETGRTYSRAPSYGRDPIVGPSADQDPLPELAGANRGQSTVNRESTLNPAPNAMCTTALYRYSCGGRPAFGARSDRIEFSCGEKTARCCNLRRDRVERLCGESGIEAFECGCTQ